MERNSQGASLAVFAEHIETSFTKEPRAYRIQADITDKIVEYSIDIDLKSIRQGVIDLAFTFPAYS